MAERRRYLVLTIEEKFVGVNAVNDGTSKEWYPVEYYRRLIWSLVGELAENIKDDREHDEREGACSNNDADGLVRQ